MQDNNDFVDRSFCNERSANIEKWLNKIDKNIDRLYTRLNWFYVITISTLAAIILKG